MPKTEKVKTTGRFGSRYGVGIRKRVLKVELKQKLKHSCSQCGFKTVKRIAPGIFECKKCGLEFAGGAFVPTTMTGGTVKKIVSQRSFGAAAALLEQSEQEKEPEAVERASEQQLTEKKESPKEEKPAEEKKPKKSLFKKEKKDKK